MKQKLEEVALAAQAALSSVKDLPALEAWHVEYLGRKRGKITEIMKSLGALSPDEKRVLGPLANKTKQELEEAYGKKLAQFGEQAGEAIDTTLPPIMPPQGHLHLVTQAMRDITDIFKRIGFMRVRHPEVDWDYYAFESLNMPQGHPARDDWETFFITPEEQKGQRMVLTPHTSNGQVREMEKGKLPIRMINIAKCYRRQSDVTHTQMFHQFEGLYVDKDVSIRHLKGVMDYFAKSFFGPEREIRLRPFHFQFTEPSFEIDITCGLCLGKGCKFCKEGWVELGGSGMTHPVVLKFGGIDPKQYSAFAFGWGVERVALMREGLAIPDLRELYRNDVRFLQQF
ncbi:MAG: phenylalanine--tRNA ligase subunit alpha [Parcubacteria group bacterium]|nr:phenylalanine--tRNA ligase subunit alpha [Parcubacteria group bacterium]